MFVEIEHSNNFEFFGCCIRFDFFFNHIEPNYCTLSVPYHKIDLQPAVLSFADSSPPVLADQSPAPATSFLSQECNATVKFSASGKYKELVPSSVYRLYPSAKKMLRSGFFAIEVFPKVLEKETPITKVQVKLARYDAAILLYRRLSPFCECFHKKMAELFAY